MFVFLVFLGMMYLCFRVDSTISVCFGCDIPVFSGAFYHTYPLMFIQRMRFRLLCSLVIDDLYDLYDRESLLRGLTLFTRNILSRWSRSSVTGLLLCSLVLDDPDDLDYLDDPDDLDD